MIRNNAFERTSWQASYPPRQPDAQLGRYINEWQVEEYGGRNRFLV